MAAQPGLFPPKIAFVRLSPALTRRDVVNKVISL